MADKGSSSSERTVSGPDSRREGRIDKLEDTVHNLVDVMTRFMTALNTTHNLTNVHQTAEDGNRVAGNQAAVSKGSDEATKPHGGGGVKTPTDQDAVHSALKGQGTAQDRNASPYSAA